MIKQRHQGDKITLREFVKSDMPKLLEWASNPVIVKYNGIPATDSETMYKGLMNRIIEGRIVFIIEVVERPIGSIYIDIDEKNKKAEFHIIIGEDDCRGKGYGTEATKLSLDYVFNELKLNKVFLEVLDFNIPAINLYEKLGFKKDGVLRKDIYLNGKYENHIIMSLLKIDYD